jgi:hypothetical protein
VVEGGVWGNKYYGGYNTSMSFDYNSTKNEYSLPEFSNAWVFPEACDSLSHMNGTSATESYLNALYGSNESSHSSVPSEATGYLKTSWYLTDVETQSILFGYDLPYCASDGSLTNYLGCIQDGSYIFRSTGVCDPRSSNYSWTFCGKSGGAQEEFRFTVSNGTCAANNARRTNEINLISSPPEPQSERPSLVSVGEVEEPLVTSPDLKDALASSSSPQEWVNLRIVLIFIGGVGVAGLVVVWVLFPLFKPKSSTRESRSPSHPL